MPRLPGACPVQTADTRCRSPPQFLQHLLFQQESPCSEPHSLARKVSARAHLLPEPGQSSCRSQLTAPHASSVGSARAMRTPPSAQDMRMSQTTTTQLTVMLDAVALNHPAQPVAVEQSKHFAPGMPSTIPRGGLPMAWQLFRPLRPTQRQQRAA